MPLDASIGGDSSDINRMIDETLSHQARRTYILQRVIELRARTEAQRQGAKITMTVDGIKNTTEAMIKDTSVVIFSFQWISDLVRWIDQQLIEASPVEQNASKAPIGQFQRSFILFVDGKHTDIDGVIDEEASEYVIMNTQPYASKIEHGESPQAPHGIFEGIALLAANLVNKDWATVHFEYRTPPVDEIVLRHFGGHALDITPSIIISVPVF